MATKIEEPSTLVSRISISLAPVLLTELDQMVKARNFGSRSQAASDMVNRQLLEYKRSPGKEVIDVQTTRPLSTPAR